MKTPKHSLRKIVRFLNNPDEDGVVDTIMREEDTDSNAAIYGTQFRRCAAGWLFRPSGSTPCTTAAQGPNIGGYFIHARNASGRWMYESRVRG